MVTNTDKLQTESKQSRNNGLDVLRIYAIFSVVYGHGWYIANHIVDKRYLIFKYDSVTIFFVVSGFLVGLKFFKYLENNAVNINNIRVFWLKRLFKIYPSYFLLVFLVGVMAYISYEKLPAGYWLLLVFSQNFATPHIHAYPELWSLAIQEWFYILLPMSLYAISKLRTRRKILISALIILFSIFMVTALRVFRGMDIELNDFATWDIVLRKQVLTRLDSALYGSLAALILIKFPELFKKYAIHALVLALVLMVLDKNTRANSWFYTNYITLTISSIYATLLLPFFYKFDIQNAFVKRVIRRLSNITLEMYILHLTPVMFVLLPYAMGFVEQWAPAKTFNYFVSAYMIYWALTISLSLTLNAYFTKPMDQFLTRKFIQQNH